MTEYEGYDANDEKSDNAGGNKAQAEPKTVGVTQSWFAGPIVLIVKKVTWFIHTRIIA